MAFLYQFLLRLSFGLAAAMALTDSRLVTSGYYRNNLYVLLGLDVLASLVAWSAPVEAALPFWPAVVAAGLCYVGAVMWLYNLHRPGTLTLGLLGGVSLVAAWLAVPQPTGASSTVRTLFQLDPFAGGFLLGTTMAAMLLGHWYLNTPGMKLDPLKRLLKLMAAAVVIRMAFAAVALAVHFANDGTLTPTQISLVTLRWLAGLVGPAVLAWMSWKTLLIPNTQSATGILYVGVIGVFLGEMTAALLSGELGFPL